MRGSPIARKSTFVTLLQTRIHSLTIRHLTSLSTQSMTRMSKNINLRAPLIETRRLKYDHENINSPNIVCLIDTDLQHVLDWYDQSIRQVQHWSIQSEYLNVLYTNTCIVCLALLQFLFFYLYYFFSVRLLSVLCDHSLFSSRHNDIFLS